MKTNFQYRHYKKSDWKHFIDDILESIGDVFDEFDWQKPATNLYETQEAYEVELAVPGVDKADFKIQIISSYLVISVKKEEETDEHRTCIKRGFSFKNFSRRIRVPEQIDREQVKARYKRGILTVILPKQVVAKEDDGTDIPVE